MGWWGYDIMEGDTPLDCRSDLINYLADQSLLKTDDDDDMCDDMYYAIEKSAKDALRFPLKSIATMRSIQNGELCNYSQTIAMQVLGEMIMASGQPFPTEVRSAAVAAAEAEIKYGNGGWRTAGARELRLNAYIRRVWAYVDGVAQEPSSKGLFQTFAEKMAETS